MTTNRDIAGNRDRAAREPAVGAYGVALLPGTAFGLGGAEHLRISYATTRVALENALARLRESLLHLATAA